MDSRLVDPLELVMVGDITDLDGFVTRQNARLGVDVLNRTVVRRLVVRRYQNNFPGALLELRSAHLFLMSELQDWHDAYVLTHPDYLGGRLLDAVKLAIMSEAETC